jgi:hypothetical protein
MAVIVVVVVVVAVVMIALCLGLLLLLLLLSRCVCLQFFNVLLPAEAQSRCVPSHMLLDLFYLIWRRLLAGL